jgi:hypothetical protein
MGRTITAWILSLVACGTDREPVRDDTAARIAAAHDCPASTTNEVGSFAARRQQQARDQCITEARRKLLAPVRVHVERHCDEPASRELANILEETDDGIFARDLRDFAREHRGCDIAEQLIAVARSIDSATSPASAR